MMVPVPPVVTVLLATPDDAEAIAALVHAAYRSDESRSGWTTEADLVGGQRTDAPMVREMILSPASVVLVGVGGRESAGALILACCLVEHRGESAYLGMFAVRPGRQGQGVGRAMLQAAQELARSHWGATSIQLTVLDRRPELVAWYERCGFILTGVRHAFPYGDERFGVPRHPDLVLLEMSRELAPPT